MLEHFKVFGHAGFFVRWMPRRETRLAIRKLMLKGTINTLKIVGIAVIVLIVVIVVLQNTQAVETKLWFLSVTMPNAVLLFATLIIGFAIGVRTAGHIVSHAKQGPTEEHAPGKTVMQMREL